MSEKADYCNAVDRFAEAMKARMIQKHKQGFHGWDCGSFHTHDIPGRLLTKAAQIVTLGHKTPAKSLVDIANFAMMLWLKLNQRR